MYLRVNHSLIINSKSIDEVRAVQNKNSSKAYHLEISANGNIYRIGYYPTADDAYKAIIEFAEEIGEEVYNIS